MRRARTLATLAWMAALVTGLLVFPGSAVGHAGHKHVPLGPPAPEWAWGDSQQQLRAAARDRDARGHREFAAALAAAPAERGGRCVTTAEFEGVGEGCRTADGLLRVQLPGDGSVLTHGPDYLEAAIDTTAGELPTRMVAAVRDASSDDIECVPASEQHTRLVYAIPADGVDRSAQVAAELRRSTYELSAVLDNEARSLDPTAGRQLKLLCDGSSVPLVDVHRLPTPSGSASFSTVQADLHAAAGSSGSAGLVRYLVYYDEHLGSYAGIGQFVRDETGSAANDNNEGGRVALQDNSSGAGSPSWEVLLHEAAHNMGAVQDGAPDSNGLGHCNDGRDVMCYEEGLGTYVDTVCALEQFDCGHDTYFHPAPPGGSYLATSWNLAATYNQYLHPYTSTADAAAPTTPTGLAGTGHANFIRLTWNAASDDGGSGVHAYRVYRDSGGGTWVPVDDSWPGDLTIDATWAGIAASTSYTLRVTAFDRRGNESAPATVTVDTGAIAGTRVVGGSLDAPTDVHVAASTTTSVTIAWTPIIGPDDTRYRIQRRTGTGSWTTGATTSQSSYEYPNLVAGTSYEFRVTAYDPTGRVSTETLVSAWTTGGPDSTPPDVPTNVRIASSQGTSPTVAWDAPGGTPSSYVVSVETSPGVWSQVGSTAQLQHAVTGLGWATTRMIGVAARDVAGNVSARGTVSFTPPPAPDTTAPSSPSISSATRTTTSITPSWSAATDNVGVVGYRVYVAPASTGHFLLATTTSGALTATATGLTPNTTYRVRVQAIDAAGYGSTSLSYVQVTTQSDTTAPTAPTGLGASNQTTATVDLTWTAATDDSGVASYRVFRREADLSWTLIGTTTSTSHTVTGLTASTGYTFGVRAVDVVGLESTTASVATTTASSADTTAPSTPGALATSSVSGTSVALTWSASTDDVSVTGYRVYRQSPSPSATPIGTPTDTSFTATDLTPATTYTLEVSAVDGVGNESARASVTFTTPDTIAPSAPSGLVVGDVTETQATISWNASSDNVGVSGYRVTQTAPAPETVLTTTTGLSYAMTGLQPATTYTITVTAVDTAGNETAASVSFSTPDTTAPSEPGSVSAGSPTASSVPLSWSASTDNVAVSEYRIYRQAPTASGAPIATVQAPGTATTISGLESQTDYTFTVAAVDAAGNESTGASVSATTPDVTAPDQPTGLVVTLRTTTEITLGWDASTDSAGGTVQYRVFRQEADSSWTLLATTAALSWQATGLAPETDYTFGVAAIDDAGNQSGTAQVATSTLAPPDTTAPGLPGTIVADTVTGTSIAISWDAATDDRGVTGYRVYRQEPAPSATPIATPDGTSATLTGLESGVSYTFAVTAVDAAGNESGASTITVATADVVAPSDPPLLTGSALGETSVRLQWDPSTDNVGVTSYRVLREVAGVAGEIASTTLRAHDVTGLAAATTYRFHVEALDAAGNASGRATVDVTTPDLTAPTTPADLAVTSTSDTRVALDWSAASDAIGVTGYRIYRTAPTASGTPIGTTTGETSYVASGLAPDTDYTFAVSAIDAAGNESPGASVSVRTAAVPDTTGPTQPTGLAASLITQTSARVSWTAAADAGGVASYRVERLATSSWTSIGTTGALSLDLTELVAGTTHSVRVIALDVAGNESAASAMLEFTTLTAGDTTPPSAPLGPIQASATSGGEVGLGWGASSDAVGVVGYRIYQRFDTSWQQVASGTGTTVTVTGLTPGQAVWFAVAAIDAAGNESPHTVAEVQVPSVLRSLPGSPVALTAVTRYTSIDVAWQSSGGEAASSWTIVVRRPDGRVVATRTVAVSSARFVALVPNVAYGFEVTANGASGSSPAATLVARTLRDLVRPTRPARVRLIARGGRRLTILWTPSRDNVRLARYEVRLLTPRTRARVLRLRPSRRGVVATRLLRGRTYVVWVRGVDSSGNRSAWSRAMRMRVR